MDRYNKLTALRTLMLYMLYTEGLAIGYVIDFLAFIRIHPFWHQHLNNRFVLILIS